MADKTLPPLAFGDSLADGIRTNNKLEGKTRSGAGPREVLDMILSYSLHNSLEGRDVFIGTGIPNIPEQKKFIEEQIELVKRKGGRPILIGVGPGTEKNPTTGQNEFLAELTKRKGLPFMGPLINIYPDVAKDKMGLHLRPSQYKQIIQNYSTSATQAKTQAAPKIEVAPPPPKSAPQSTRTQAPTSNATSAVNMLLQMPGVGKGEKFDPDVYLQNPNVNKFLDYINVYEGSPKANQMVGFKEFNDFKDHPRTPVVFNKKGDKSDAAGMFQILSRTWDGQRKKLGLTDFSLINQKRAAVGILHDIGALPDIISGNFDKAKPKAARQWASIPGSTIGLPTGQVPRYKEEAERILGRPTRRAENPMMPRVEVPVEDTPGSTLESAPRTAQQGPAQPNQVTTADLERMGPSYQAALAAMTLGDSKEDDDEYDDDETIAERYLERRGEQVAQEEDSTLETADTTPRTSPLAALSEISYQSPFGPEPGTEEQQPVMMAEGGDPAQEKDIDYKEYVREQLRKDPLYAGLGDGDRGSARQELAAFELSKDPRIALMMMGNAGELIRDPVTGAVIGTGIPAVMGRLGIDKEGARAGVSGAAVRLPDGSIKVFPGSADVGYSTPMYKGNLDVSADYGLGNLPRPMYGGRVRYSQSFKDGGVVYRADGSPLYGEGVDVSNSGGITADTIKNLFSGPRFDPREALRVLKNIGVEGVSNLESVARGSVAGVPGVVGDIESLFRDDKKRKFATSAEVERDYLPKRGSKPTKEASGFVEIGTAIDPTIALKAVKPTAKATLEALKASGPQVESALMKLAPASKPMNIVKYEGGNWFPTRERSDVIDDYINNLLKDTRVNFDLDFKKKMQSIAESRLDNIKDLYNLSNQSTKRIYQETGVASASRKKKIEMAEGMRPIKARHREDIIEAQKLLDEAKDQTAIPQSISDFIEKKLQPYIRNKLGTPSDQIRTGMDKWALEIQPKLIAEKQKQIDKLRADIAKAVSDRGNINPLLLTNSQEQLRKLMNEMEGIKSRTGSFFQMERPAMEALVRRYENPTTLNYSVLAKNRQIGLGATDSPETLVKAKSTAGKAWENTVDSSIDAYTPRETASEYASVYGKEPPAWLTKAEQSTDQKGIFAMPYRSGETLATQFRHMIDEIRSSMYPQTNVDLPKDLRITPKDLEKMSVEDVSALVDKINGWRVSNVAGVDLARANTPAVTEIKTYKTIPNTDLPNEKNLRWVEIKMPEGMDVKEGRKVLDDALKYEGEIMKHCVGAYCPNVEEGTKIFSLRDDTGRPYTTIEAAPDMELIDDIFEKELGEGARHWKRASRKEILDALTSEFGYEIPYAIKQIKGVRNGAPIEEAIPFVRDFARNPKWTDVADINLIGGL